MSAITIRPRKMAQSQGRTCLPPFTLLPALNTQETPEAAQNLGPSEKPPLCGRCVAAAQTCWFSPTGKGPSGCMKPMDGEAVGVYDMEEAGSASCVPLSQSPQLAVEVLRPPSTNCWRPSWEEPGSSEKDGFQALLLSPYLLPFCLLYWCSNPSAHFPAWSQISFIVPKGKEEI